MNNANINTISILLLWKTCLIMWRLLESGFRMHSSSCILIGFVRVVWNFSRVSSSFKEPFLTLGTVEINHLYKLATVWCDFYGNNNGSSTMELSAGAQTVINTSLITSFFFPRVFHTTISGETKPRLHAHLNSCHCAPCISLHSLRLTAYDWGYHLVCHMQPLTESWNQWKTFFSLEQEIQTIHELSNKSEWTKNSWAAGQILAGKPEISRGNDIKYKTLSYVLITIFFKLLTHWKWWHI